MSGRTLRNMLIYLMLIDPLTKDHSPVSSSPCYPAADAPTASPGGRDLTVIINVINSYDDDNL